MEGSSGGEDAGGGAAAPAAATPAATTSSGGGGGGPASPPGLKKLLTLFSPRGPGTAAGSARVPSLTAVVASPSKATAAAAGPPPDGRPPPAAALARSATGYVPESTLLGLAGAGDAGGAGDEGTPLLGGGGAPGRWGTSGRARRVWELAASVPLGRARIDPKSRLARRLGFGLVFYLVLLGDGNRGLVLPTLQRYLGKYDGSAQLVGLANAGFSLGRLLVAPFYGLWMDRRSAGEVFVFTCVLSAGANLLYTYASWWSRVGVDPAYVIVLSRTVLGAGASVLGVGRGYIGKKTAKAERGAYIALLCAFQYAGFTATSVISMLNFSSVAWLDLDSMNMPGFLLVLAYLVGIALLLLLPSNLFVVERKPAARRKKRALGLINHGSYPQLMSLMKTPSERSVAGSATGSRDPSPLGSKRGSFDGGPAGAARAWGSHPPPTAETPLLRPPEHNEPSAARADETVAIAIERVASWKESLEERAQSSMRALCNVPGIVAVFVLLNFAVRAVLATLETLSINIMSYIITGSTNPKDWAHSDALWLTSTVFFVLGLVGLLMFAFLYCVEPYIKDRVLLLAGLATTLVGIFVMCDFHDGRGLPREIGLVRFEVGLGIAWAVGYPITQTVVVSALSKVLTKEQQGLWMGNLASAGSAGRIVAPILAGVVYTQTRSHTGLIPLLGCAGVTLGAFLLILAHWRRLGADAV